MQKIICVSMYVCMYVYIYVCRLISATLHLIYSLSRTSSQLVTPPAPLLPLNTSLSSTRPTWLWPLHSMVVMLWQLMSGCCSSGASIWASQCLSVSVEGGRKGVCSFLCVYVCVCLCLCFSVCLSLSLSYLDYIVLFLYSQVLSLSYLFFSFYHTISHLT